MIYSITKKKIVELIMSEFQGGFREGGVEDGDKGSDAKKQELALQRQLAIQQAVRNRVEVAVVEGAPTPVQVKNSAEAARNLKELLPDELTALKDSDALTVEE